MLVLTRKANERIILEDEVTGREIIIQVVSLKNGQVRLGLIADDDVRILREELKDNRAHASLALAAG